MKIEWNFQFIHRTTRIRESAEIVRKILNLLLVKIFPKILLVLAGLILLLHSILPHEHHPISEEGVHFSKCEASDSLFEVILLAYHMDQGEGHLEIFKAADGLNLDLKIFPAHDFLISPEPIPAEKERVLIPIQQIQLSNWLFASPLSFRGPPQIS